MFLLDSEAVWGLVLPWVCDCMAPNRGPVGSCSGSDPELA